LTSLYWKILLNNNDDNNVFGKYRQKSVINEQLQKKSNILKCCHYNYITQASNKHHFQNPIFNSFLRLPLFGLSLRMRVRNDLSNILY
jgi:hypothetical protein